MDEHQAMSLIDPEPRKGLKNEEHFKTTLFSQIPDGYELGKAYDRGDCFFDALAQRMNEIHDTDENTAKSLRALCHTFYMENKELVDEWNASEYGGIDGGANDYYTVLYTADECDKDLNRRSPVWGRPDIEGIILCRELNLEGIFVIEVLKHPETMQPVLSFHLANSSNYRSIDEDDEEAQVWLNKSDIPTLIVGEDLHCVPLLMGSQHPQEVALEQPNERSRIVNRRSVVNFNHSYNRDSWAISLIHHGGMFAGHAEIIVEGIEENGELHFKAYHISFRTADIDMSTYSHSQYKPECMNNYSGTARVEIIDHTESDLVGYIGRCHRRRCWNKPRVIAQAMIQNIESQVGTPVKYQRCGSYSIWRKDDTVTNCLDWCRNKLGLANIDISVKPLDYIIKSVPAKHAHEINDTVYWLFSPVKPIISTMANLAIITERSCISSVKYCISLAI